MRNSFFLPVCFAVGLAVRPCLAQDPTVVAPRNYHLEFENDYVRVVRNTLRPHDSLPEHQHPLWPTVYVYLTDAGRTRFDHITPSYTIDRRPVRAGGVRFNHNPHEETHTIEYFGDEPSEYLRIELKTVQPNPQRDVRLEPEDPGPYDGVQIRISRHVCAAGAVCEMPVLPAVVVSLTERTAAWSEPGAVPRKRNGGAGALNYLWVELKTKPR